MGLLDEIEYALGVPANEGIFNGCIEKKYINENTSFSFMENIERIINKKIKNIELKLNNLDFIDGEILASNSKDFSLTKKEMDRILEKLTQEDKQKEDIEDNIFSIAFIIFLRNFGLFCLSIDDEGYFVDIAILFSQKALATLAVFLWSRIDTKKFDNYISTMNTKKAQSRWGNKVEQQRKRYLEHFKQQGFTTYKSCAMWIYENDNPENLDFDTIKKHLSQADKGNFSNKK